MTYGEDVIKMGKILNFKNFDFPFLIISLLLTSLGLLTLYSASVSAFSHQIFFFAFGLLVYFVVSQMDFHVFGKVSTFIYLLTLSSLLAILIFGEIARGSTRWFNVGSFNIQPSEFAKIGLVLTLAFLLSRPSKSLSVKSFVLSGIVSLPIIILVFLEPDFGTAIVLFGSWLGLIFYSGLKLWQILFFGSFACFFSYPVWLKLKPYQKDRILFFLNPALDPLGKGYNVIQAMIAVGSGGIFGLGLGRGTQSHLWFLPEHYTDFVFATFAEEWGFIGCLVMLLLFFLLLLKIILIAGKADSFGGLVCTGVFIYLAIQIFINLGMNLGVMPITGIPLPLISYGGSSFLSTFFALGLVQSVARQKSVDIGLPMS